MTEPDDIPHTEAGHPPRIRQRSREERERRRAEIRSGRIPPDIEASPEMQALRRSQEVFRAEIKAAVRKITGR